MPLEAPDQSKGDDQMTYTQKDIAQLLDRAAARAHQVGRTPATRKQIWYLAGLMVPEVERHGVESEPALHDSNFVLCVKKASSQIDIHKI
jgi:hypothetical protein